MLILFDNPQLNVGQLKAYRQYTIDSSIFPDGERNINQIEMLPIEIVYKYSGRKQEPNPIDITPKPYEIIMLEQVTVEAIQGRTGENGVDAMIPDCSLLTEQELKDRFWFNENGEKFKMYTKTVIASFPYTKTGAMGIQGCIISVDGYIHCYSETYHEPLYINCNSAIFRNAGMYGIHFDIHDSYQGEKYELNFIYYR